MLRCGSPWLRVRWMGSRKLIITRLPFTANGRTSAGFRNALPMGRLLALI
jgi:hypothetical protein